MASAATLVAAHCVDSRPVAEFRSAKEFREIMDRTFALMSDDPDMGPKLRDADTPLFFPGKVLADEAGKRLRDFVPEAIEEKVFKRLSV